MVAKRIVEDVLGRRYNGKGQPKKIVKGIIGKSKKKDVVDKIL